MSKNKKIHLIPDAAGAKYAVCAVRLESTSLTVKSRDQFNALAKDVRCPNCDIIVNGRK